MAKIKNSEILKKLLIVLMIIAGRRSTETIACAFIDAILKTLEEKYIFLKLIKIKNPIYQEGLIENAIKIDSKIDSIDKRTIGDVIESIIRILCMDLEEDTGLFFIKEIRDKIGDRYLKHLKDYGVDLEVLKLEQEHLHEQLERKKAIIHHHYDESKNSKIEVEMLNYSWDAVASFKYRTNICFLYDKNGKLLDKLHVHKIIEYYVRTLTDFGKLVLKENKIEISDKQYSLLELLYERDVDEESAKYLLGVTTSELNYMIQELLRYEFLQYVTYNEIKLTEKAIDMLNKKREKIIEVTVD